MDASHLTLKVIKLKFNGYNVNHLPNMHRFTLIWRQFNISVSCLNKDDLK